MAQPQDDRSLGELFSELSRETGILVRKEFELATTEMTAKAKVAGAHLGIVALGGALLHAGLLVLLAAIVIGLMQAGVTAWLAALMVAVVTAAGGYALVTSGLARLRRTSVFPVQAIDTLKETATWTKKTHA